MLARKARKMLCVKTLGELVKKWRKDAGLGAADLAALVNAATPPGEREKPVQRQHIEQLEKAGNRLPQYVVALAKVMGSTVDDLLALKMPPAYGTPPSPRPADENQAAPAWDPSARERAIVAAVKTLYTDEQIDELTAQAMTKMQAEAELLRRNATITPPGREQFNPPATQGKRARR